MSVAKSIIALMATVLAVSAHAKNWWDDDPWSDPERGFNWYPPAEQLKPAPSKPVEQPKPAKPKNIREMTTVEGIHKEWKRLRDQAIMFPTEKNIYDYLDANQFVQERAAYFADSWRRVVWQNPDVDYNVRNPQANFAQTAIKEQRSLDERTLLASLAKTHGILFFYRSDCQFCHLQAPVLKMLQDQFGIEVLAVSIDGGPIKEFPNAKRDNGISLAVTQGRGVDIVPSVFLVSNDQRTVVPVGSGVLAMDEIVSRIRVLVTTKPGENF